MVNSGALNGAVKNKLLLGVRISICIPLLFLKYHIAVDRESKMKRINKWNQIVLYFNRNIHSGISRSKSLSSHFKNSRIFFLQFFSDMLKEKDG